MISNIKQSFTFHTESPSKLQVQEYDIGDSVQSSITGPRTACMQTLQTLPHKTAYEEARRFKTILRRIAALAGSISSQTSLITCRVSMTTGGPHSSVLVTQQSSGANTRYLFSLCVHNYAVYFNRHSQQSFSVL